MHGINSIHKGDDEFGNKALSNVKLFDDGK